jgi:membrane associated rhomboid family serine protease
MIRLTCECQQRIDVAAESLNRDVPCPRCGRVLRPVAAEAVLDTSAGADFDVTLVQRTGPGQGRCLVPGGYEDLVIGKLPECHIVLPGKLVSRRHCRLIRAGTAPSRWRVVDNGSTNGVFVNGQRVKDHLLAPGDVLTIGEFEFLYRTPAAPAAAAPPPLPLGPAVPQAPRPKVPVIGEVCPSCQGTLPPGAKVCVNCGIDIRTGRPIVISHGVDEDAVVVRSETILSLVSWFVPVTPLPIPLVSEAYGRRRPWVIWALAALTVVVSLWFFFAVRGDSAEPMRWMLWPPAQSPEHAAAHAVLAAELGDELGDAVEFHPYQLLTHALLHDPSSIGGFLGHLVGNMLFLLVFGTRVNAALGQALTAITYPLLAIAAATFYLMMTDSTVPMLGASGAINGLAGAYLILFPVQKVYCAMWIRIRLWWTWRIFAMRGFWIPIIYVAFDSAMIYLRSHLGDGEGGGTAHWAHIGGFLAGVVLALGLLASRQFNLGGGDLLSVVLGKYAWPLIGKPGRWSRD